MSAGDFPNYDELKRRYADECDKRDAFPPLGPWYPYAPPEPRGRWVWVPDEYYPPVPPPYWTPPRPTYYC